MGDALEQLLRERGGVVLRDELLAIGIGPDRLYRQLCRGVWRAEGRRVVVHGSAPDGLITESLVAALMYREAILTGPSAALLRPQAPWAGRTFPGHPVTLIAPRSQRGRPWLTVRHPGAEFDVASGVKVADTHTILVDLLRLLPWREAAAIAGAASQQGLTTHERLRQSTELLRCASGAAQLQRLVRAMVRGAESGPEIDLHEALHRAQIQGWVANPTISIPGGPRRPDIAFLKERVAIEYDGIAAHSPEPAFHADRSRICDMHFGQWLVLPITKLILYDDKARPTFFDALRILLAQRRGR